MGISVDQMQDKLEHLQSPTGIANLLSTAHAACLYTAEQACHGNGSRTWQVRFDALDGLCDEAEARLRGALPNSADAPHAQPPPGDSPAAHCASTHMDDHHINTWRMMHDHDGRTMHGIDMRQRSMMRTSRPSRTPRARSSLGLHSSTTAPATALLPPHPVAFTPPTAPAPSGVPARRLRTCSTTT